MTHTEKFLDRVTKTVKNAVYASPDSDVTDLQPVPRADGTPAPKWDPRKVGFVLPGDFEIDALTGKHETDEEWQASTVAMRSAMQHLDNAGLAEDLFSSDASPERRRAAAALFLSDLIPVQESE